MKLLLQPAVLVAKLMVILMVSGSLISCSKENPPGPPNIIYILADDMGYGDLGCYGQQTIRTPNIDALAAAGMRFTQHYAGATVCAPSRAALLTGKHTGHVSVRGNAPAGQLLQPGEITLPEALKGAGYRSAMVGKWGIGHPPTPDDPILNGFDSYYGYINMWHAHNFYPEFMYKNGQKVALEGNATDQNLDYAKHHPGGMPEGTGVAAVKETYVLEEIQREALAFIDSNQTGPFFLYLALNMPHANNEAGYFLQDGMEVPVSTIEGQQVADYGTYAGQDWPNPEKGFAAMMELIDQTVALVESKVAALGLTENTVIIFASDNGPHEEGGHKCDFFDSNGPLRGAKRDLYEGGIRVPMIVKWPGKISPGVSTDHLSAFWDLLPTFCDLAGVPAPAGLDGISFLPTLLGQPEKQQQHDWLYWEFYELGGRQAIRKGPWKYIKLNVRDPEKEVKTELYNLDSDLGETMNLLDQHPELAESLNLLLEQAHSPHPLLNLFAMEKSAETAF